MYHDIIANPKRSFKSVAKSHRVTIEKEIGKMLESINSYVKTDDDANLVVDGIKQLETYLLKKFSKGEANDDE